jgi:hypothetical protein
VDDLEGMNKGAEECERSDLFHAGNLDRIKDAPPNATAAVHRHDVMTMSELARRGFHLIDMSGEIWMMRRAG